MNRGAARLGGGLAGDLSSDLEMLNELVAASYAASYKASSLKVRRRYRKLLCLLGDEAARCEAVTAFAAKAELSERPVRP